MDVSSYDAVEFQDFKSQYATVADYKSATTEFFSPLLRRMSRVPPLFWRVSGSGFREKDHVHFSDGTALNKDGTWKHIKNKTHKFTNEEKKYLKENGWKIPE